MESSVVKSEHFAPLNAKHRQVPFQVARRADTEEVSASIEQVWSIDL